MKTLNIIAFIVAALFAGSNALAQTAKDPWTAAQLKPTEELAKQIEGPAAARPVIINVGPQAVIKGSLDAGEGRDHANIDKLKALLAKQDKNKEVVLYCGCCPFEKCPNVRPAFSAMQSQGFKNPRLLDIPKNIKTNWIDKGYPVN